MSNVLGDSVQGTLLDRAVDVYDFVAASAGEIRLAFTHPAGFVTNGQSIRLKLTDALDNQIAMLTANGNDELIATVPSAGHYFLSVEEADPRINTPAAYAVASTLTFAPGIMYEGGANDTTLHAQSTLLGTPIHGRLDNGDTDYFKISSDTGGVLTLRFTHPHGQGTGGRAIDVTVTDAASNIVTREQLKGDATLLTTVSGAGNYFVSVKDVFSGEANDRGLYQLTPSLDHYPKVVYDGPANDSPATALALPLGATAIGNLEPSDVDYYKIEASSGGTLSLNFLHPHGPGNSGSYIGIKILDGSGNQIVNKAEHGNALFTTELADGGTYYVGIADTLHKTEPGLYKFMAGLANNGGKVIAGNATTPFAGTGGNDVIHGATGRDTVQYQGGVAGYEIDVSPAGARVRDTAGLEGTDTLFNVERLRFADKAVALDVDGDGGRLFRLYQATFDRAPDEAGFGFWLNHLDGGVRMHTLADAFIDSDEFHGKYGHLDNGGFIDALYDNILHRDYDQAGFDYWLRVLDQKLSDRAEVLIGFANSTENAAQVVGSTLHGIVYEPWMNA